MHIAAYLGGGGGGGLAPELCAFEVEAAAARDTARELLARQLRALPAEHCRRGCEAEVGTDLVAVGRTHISVRTSDYRVSRERSGEPRTLRRAMSPVQQLRMEACGVGSRPMRFVSLDRLSWWKMV
eukprot:SAG11_NODE_16012_length_559_cov_1.156522_1_plen_126_part_00